MKTDEQVADIMAMGDECGEAWEALTAPTAALQETPSLANVEALLAAGSHFMAKFSPWLEALDKLSGDMEVDDTSGASQQGRLLSFAGAMIASEGEDCGPAPSIPIDPDELSRILQWVPRA